MEDDELFVIVRGYLPFDDTNLAVLYEKGDAQFLKKRRKMYLLMTKFYRYTRFPWIQIGIHIGMSSCLDLSWFFEKEGECDIGEGEWTGAVLDIRERL
nr:hypothetical protein [Tanacetum cinerariifolium]